MITRKNSFGFSMIEVMVSVVVLGFGLMALAALQTSLIRSSAETKTQTIALQLAKDKVEDLRSFDTLEDYRAITSGTDTLNDDGGDLGGVNFSRAWTVTRFAFDNDVDNDGILNEAGDQAFVSTSTLTGPTPAGFVTDNEYKRVLVTVEWTDANGAEQSVSLEDGLGAVSPSDGSKVVLNTTASSLARKPRVLIYNPGNSGGVIPIAVGNGTSTAASNPVPVVSKKNAVTETTFEVLTYAGTTGSVLAQSRVETAVVHCSCSTANAPTASTARGFRPTYWNGYRYAPPARTTDKPKAGWVFESVQNIDNLTESTRCNACCRDHRDESIATGDPRFDPWRTSHLHYKKPNLTTPVSSGAYDEACRLIRVDGIFRVAADLRNDYFAFLETNNNGDITNPDENLRAYSPRVSSTAAEDSKKKYEAFVLDYMDDRFSANQTSSTYNTPLATSSYELAYGLNSPVDSDGKQTPIPMKSSATEKSADSKWTHARGLYIDYIENDARDVIAKARENCAATSQAGRNACVLPYVPFTSINLTELADWKSKLTADDAALANQNVIRVANNAFIDSVNTNVPTRGNVSKGLVPKANDKAYAIAYITESNSGLALETPIDPDEISLKDAQQYVISDSSGGTSSDIAFTVNITGQRNEAPWPIMGNTSLVSCDQNSNTNPNPYSCNFAPDLSGKIQLKVTGYSFGTQIFVPNGCDTLLSGTKPNPNANVALPIVLDYDVFKGTGPGLVSVGIPSGDNTTDDATIIDYSSVVSGSVLGVEFTGPVRTCPDNYKVQPNILKGGTPDPVLNCTKGGTPQPQWSTTYVTCPTGTPGI